MTESQITHLVNCTQVSAPTILSIFSATTSAVLGPLITIGNILVALSVFLDPNKELKTPFNFFVVNLAIADLIVGLVTCPLAIVTHCKEAYGASNEMLKPLRQSLHFSYFASVSASVLNLAALCIDRVIAIRFPLKYRVKLTCWHHAASAIAIWVIAISIPTVYFYIGYLRMAFIMAIVVILFTILVMISTFFILYISIKRRDRHTSFEDPHPMDAAPIAPLRRINSSRHRFSSTSTALVSIPFEALRDDAENKRSNDNKKIQIVVESRETIAEDAKTALNNSSCCNSAMETSEGGRIVIENPAKILLDRNDSDFNKEDGDVISGNPTFEQQMCQHLNIEQDCKADNDGQCSMQVRVEKNLLPHKTASPLNRQFECVCNANDTELRLSHNEHIDDEKNMKCFPLETPEMESNGTDANNSPTILTCKSIAETVSSTSLFGRHCANNIPGEIEQKERKEIAMINNRDARERDFAQERKITSVSSISETELAAISKHGHVNESFELGKDDVFMEGAVVFTKETDSTAIRIHTQNSPQNRKLEITLLIMLAVFLICFVPTFGMIMYLNSATGSCELRHWLRDVHFLLATANSAMNPFIYAWRLPAFKKAIRSILRCVTKNRIKPRGSSRKRKGYEKQ